MSFVENKNFVQTFFSYSTHPALGESVGIGGLEGCGHDSEILRLKHGIKGIRVLGVIISNQATEVGFCLFKLPHKLSGLLSDPSTVRVGSYSC